MSGVTRLPWLFVAALAWCSLPVAAQEVSIPVSGFLPQTWETDVPGGFSEEQLRQLPCTVNSLSLRLRVTDTSIDQEGDFLPRITVRIGTGAFSNLSAPEAEGALLVIVPDTRTVMSGLAFLKVTGGRLSQLTPVGILARNEEAALSFNWTPDGKVSVRLNNDAGATIALSRPPESLILTISGAKAKLTNIRAGYSGGPRPETCPAKPANPNPSN